MGAMAIVGMNISDKRPKRTLSTNGKNGQEGKNQNKNPTEESNWPIPPMEDSDWLLFTQIDTQRTIVGSPLSHATTQCQLRRFRTYS